MNRTQKQEWVAGLEEGLKSAEIVIVSHYKGLTVAQMSDLRVKVRKAGAKFKVTKNRLTKRALGSTRFGNLSDLFKGPTAVAYANDPVAVAKVLVDFAKDNENLVVLGGAFGDRALDVKGVQALARLPSLNELRAKIIGMLQTPATRIACVLQAPAGQVARVISAKSKKE